MRHTLLIASLGLLSLVSAPAYATPPNQNCPEVTTSATKPALDAPLDLNAATATDLEKLPGIGPSRAQQILAFRDAHGGFTNVNQLMRIKGIGRAMLKKLVPFVTVSPKPPAATQAKTAPATQKGEDRVR